MNRDVSLSRPATSGADKLLRIALVALIYFAAARLGLLLAFEHTGASPVWPPSGIALAAMLIGGTVVWPGILCGAFLANLVVLLDQGTTSPALAVAVAAAIGVGNTLEAVAGKLLLRRLVGSGSPFDRAQDVFKFTAVALVMCLVSPLVGPVALCLAKINAWDNFGTVWLTWWLGDAAGVLVVGSLFIAWWRRPLVRWSRMQIVEAVALYGLLMALGQLLFAGWLATGIVRSLPYFTIPFLVWASFRFGQREAVTAAALASWFAIWGTVRGIGPFAGESLNESLLLLQAFVAVLSVTALALSAAVAERARAEADLRDNAAELRRSNQDLQEFAYVVSHDLKAPLRAISSLAGWIAEDYAPLLPAEGRENLSLLIGRAHRMNSLIEGILQYSRAGRNDVTLEAVDSKTLCTEVVAALSPPRSINVVIGDAMPVVVYDQTHLSQVFQNLIDNGVKHLGKPAGEIVVSAHDLPVVWEFHVKDDGVGIPQEHFDRIFKLFQTLKPKDEVESTGIGLSLVKRIVERHGGNVGVRSTLGQGSEFFFTIPK